MHNYLKFISEEMDKNDQCCQDTLLPYYNFMELSDEDIDFIYETEMDRLNNDHIYVPTNDN